MIDRYTDVTRDMLEERFLGDSDGIYFAHQPIYGFRKGYCEPGTTLKYLISFRIMEALSHLKFDSLLDVGGAEGYKAALARSLFGATVRSDDLSAEACRRAKEIYDIDGGSVDIHQLPYSDNEFDIVLCSETLEHVTGFGKAALELLRVCSKAVVITVPHDSREVVEKNIRENIVHGHIHMLDENSFSFLSNKAHSIISRRMISPFTRVLGTIADAERRERLNNYPQFLVDIYNMFVPLLKAVLPKTVVAPLARIDDLLANSIPSYLGVVIVIVKDPACYSETPLKRLSVSQIVDFKVPYHYLKKGCCAGSI